MTRKVYQSAELELQTLRDAISRRRASVEFSLLTDGFRSDWRFDYHRSVANIRAHVAVFCHEASAAHGGGVLCSVCNIGDIWKPTFGGTGGSVPVLLSKILFDPGKLVFLNVPRLERIEHIVKRARTMLDQQS